MKDKLINLDLEINKLNEVIQEKNKLLNEERKKNLDISLLKANEVKNIVSDKKNINYAIQVKKI